MRTLPVKQKGVYFVLAKVSLFYFGSMIPTSPAIARDFPRVVHLARLARQLLGEDGYMRLFEDLGV